MHLHVVMSTRMRMRLFKSKVIWEAFERAVEKSCRECGGHLLHIEAGIIEPGKGRRHIYSTAHMQVLLQGEVGPKQLTEVIRQNTWEELKGIGEEAPSRNPLTKDFYIADDAHYSGKEALRFIRNRLPLKAKEEEDAKLPGNP